MTDAVHTWLQILTVWGEIPETIGLRSFFSHSFRIFNSWRFGCA